MLVIADDLTGAADVAGAFAAGGHRCVVALDRGLVFADPVDADVLAIDADSRAMTEADAFAATADVVRRRASTELFIKVDSTLRGHVRATVEAALSAMPGPPARMVVCPAFPSHGRTVIGGRVHVDGMPLEGPRLVELLAGLPDAIAVEIPDARDDDDLAAIAASATGATLWVGSAGLARHLGRVTTPSAPLAQAPQPPVRPAARVLVVAGSQHARTAEQFALLDDGTVALVVDPRDAPFQEHVEDAVLSADALVLTGGATARAVLELLEIRTLVVRGEVEPGVPWATCSGRSGEITIVTKAGGFGDALTLRRAVRFLTGP